MKYYQLREFETDHPESHDGVVSEEELKRRLARIINLYQEYSKPRVIDAMDLDIDILVNG